MRVLQKLLAAIHKLFDPRFTGASARAFSLKHAKPNPQPPATPTPPPSPAPPPTAAERLKARLSSAEEHIDDVLGTLETDLTADAAVTIGRMKAALHADRGADLTFREFELPFDPPLKACLVFYAGVVNGAGLELGILQPLMDLARRAGRETGLSLLYLVERSLMPGRQTARSFELSVAVAEVAAGQAALILDTVPGILLIDERKFPDRAVESPVAEQVVRGPQEGFTENVLTNTGLLRRRMRSPDLVFERVVIGRRSRTTVLIAYMLGLTNPALLDEARRRLSGIDIDMLDGSGKLEQLLEDSPRGFFPTIQDTQRPDRAAAALAEGRLVIMVDGSPFALIAPVVFGNFLHSPEDYYIKWPFGSILRFIRICGLLTTLLLPATYIAIANFHQEMIPSSLLLAIAASRENVPFPAQFEVMMMEIAFEVIREGSLRIPTVLGQTVGIVGALILGQAAVMANIVSPILVIVVATTALGSFTIPNYGLSLPVRFGRFLFIGLAGTFGLYGIAAGLFLVSAQAASLRSFGVPYLAPSGPRQPASPDVVVRGAAYSMDRRPALARPMELQRQDPGLMQWNPEVPQPNLGKGKAGSREKSDH